MVAFKRVKARRTGSPAPERITAAVLPRRTQPMVCIRTAPPWHSPVHSLGTLAALGSGGSRSGGRDTMAKVATHPSCAMRLFEARATSRAARSTRGAASRASSKRVVRCSASLGSVFFHAVETARPNQIFEADMQANGETVSCRQMIARLCCEACLIA